MTRHPLTQTHSHVLVQYAAHTDTDTVTHMQQFAAHFLCRDTIWNNHAPFPGTADQASPKQRRSRNDNNQSAVGTSKSAQGHIQHLFQNEFAMMDTFLPLQTLGLALLHQMLSLDILFSHLRHTFLTLVQQCFACLQTSHLQTDIATTFLMRVFHLLNRCQPVGPFLFLTL